MCYDYGFHKVAGFVDYGSAGGVRSVEQLRLVMAELKVATVRSQVQLSLFTDFDVLNTIEANPTITLDDLAAIVDHKLETEQRALQNTKDVFETDQIFDSVRILGWIKYLIIEKNGRVPETND